VEEWLAYATPESLSLYMYQKSKTAKRLYFDVIPRAVDEYFSFLESYQKEAPEKRLDNPVWHIHRGQPSQHRVPLSFRLLLNLVSASNAHTKDILWQFVRNYAPEANPKDFPELDRLIGFAIRYFEEREKPFKSYREPTEVERGAMLDLAERLTRAGAKLSATVY
jgi:lysyl-tRNA synthetase, class I